MRTLPLPTLRLAAVLLAGTTLLLAACKEKPTPPAARTPSSETAATPASAVSQTYSVRGEIARLPETGESSPEVWIRHEAIPEFTAEDGSKPGMESMTMPFALGPQLSLEGFSVGQKVRFTLEVRWSDATAPARVTRLEKLPDDTELAFAPAPM